MDSWSQDGSIRDISLDISRLTLGVISYAAFGEQLDFTAAVSDLKSTIPPGYKLSLLHALHTVVKNMIQILVLPEWVMRMTGMSHLVLARTELEKHMRGMIQSETAMLEKDVEYKSARAPGTLLTSLLRASVKEGPTQGDGRKHAFTEDEVLGNVFIFFVAGHETSANALIYALITLAIRQDLQDKIMAEIDSVYEEAHSAGRTELTYADDFEKLEYTFGFMYEIFRLYPAVFYLVKKVSKPTYITTYPEDESTPRQYLLPANCTVHLNANGVHYHKRYWPDPSEIKPERWMTNEPSAKGHVGNPGDDNRKPDASKKARQVKGTFLFFSGGARACLGRKIAQAVFLSLMSTLLRTYRVKLAEGLKKEVVKREIDTLSRGGITLAPAKVVKLALERR
jgi:cytochrome P450